jgi:aminoglycoside phosphotransferase (APT) family kinase protein
MNSEAAALRRLDWRFLLPAPLGAERRKKMAILGASSTVLARAKDARLADHVTGHLSAYESEPFDVIAILEGSPLVPEEAIVRDALGEGGILYLEVTLQRPAGHLTLDRHLARLRQAGLSITGVYGVRPTFETAKMYLPARAPKVLAWYMENVYTPWSARGRLREWVLGSPLLPPGLRVSFFTRRFAILATRGKAARARPALLAEKGVRALLPGTAETTLLLADGGNRVTLLPFSEEGDTPIAVLKVPKLPSFNDRTENEQRKLDEIRHGLPSGIAASIPRPLGVIQLDRVSVGVETCLPGRSLERLSGSYLRSKRRKIRELEAAGEWLSRFHRTSATARGDWSLERVEEDIVVPFTAYRRTFDATPAEGALFDAAVAEARSLLGAEIPEVWQHRDFNAWNLLVHEEEIRVFDWEGARRGLPLCDLIHLVTHWHDMVQGHKTHSHRVDGFRDLFLGGTPRDSAGASVRFVIQRYMEELRLPQAFLSVALVYTWVELSLRRQRQQVDGGVERADPRTGNDLLDYVTCLAAYRQQLFPLRSEGLELARRRVRA